jgi:hypothetical protein
LGERAVRMVFETVTETYEHHSPMAVRVYALR